MKQEEIQKEIREYEKRIEAILEDLREKTHFHVSEIQVRWGDNGNEDICKSTIGTCRAIIKLGI